MSEPEAFSAVFASWPLVLAVTCAVLLTVVIGALILLALCGLTALAVEAIARALR